MLVAVEYLGPVGVGVTAPQFFRANDGKVYIVKMQNNRLGHKVLVSEYIAAVFGKLLHLCFPPNDLIQLESSIICQYPDLVECGAIPGIHFASQYLDCCTYLDKQNLDLAVNVSDMAGILLFDHFFHNADRTNNRKNILLRQEDQGCKIYAIDNSHLFRSGRWTAESVQELSPKMKVYCRYSFGMLLRNSLTPTDFIPYIERFKQLDDCAIAWIIENIPPEWSLNLEERQALVQFICARRNHLELIWAELCKYIPRNRGGRRCLMGRTIARR